MRLHQLRIISCLFLIGVFLFLNRRWRWWRTRAANAKLLWLFHTHFLHFLEGSVCLHPADRVLEWLGVLPSVNICHWFLNGRYWRPCLPLWLHRRPKRHRHCGGVCCTGDFTSWWVRQEGFVPNCLLMYCLLQEQAVRHIRRCWGLCWRVEALHTLIIVPPPNMSVEKKVTHASESAISQSEETQCILR